MYKGGREMRRILLFTSIIVIGFFSFFIMKEHLQVSFYPIIKNFEKNRIMKSLEDYQTINTEHFTVYFKEKERDIGEITGEIIEDHYDEICSYFDYYPTEDIPIIIYEKGEDIIDTIKLKGETPPLGVYYSGTINLLSPNIWLSGDNIEEEYRKTTPVIHEFTHLIVDAKTKGNYPLWLTEGLALFLEERIIGFEWNGGIGKTSDITLKDLNDNFDNIETDIAYRKSFEMVRYLNSKYEFDKFNLLLDNLGMGSNIDTSLKKVFRFSISEFSY